MHKHPLLAFLLCFTLLVSACNPIRPVASEPPSGAGSAAQSGADAELLAQVADWQLADPLPADPDIRVGKLENGLAYFLRRNSEPAKRAELRLAINAGSVQEDEDQKGLAHLLEHMLFNGTERFPKQELIDYLESIGMQFGADLNAYTSFDETVYMLQVPTDDPAILAKGLDVLEDWAGRATLDPAEIDKERGVVVEEWRLGDQGANGRIVNQWYPFILADSKYAERLPIGDIEVVKNAPAEAVRRFYETWYRPDLIAVTAVGDFDLDQVEGWVKERFNRLPVPATIVPKATVDVPTSAEDRIKLIADPENPNTFIDLTVHLAPRTYNTVGDFRDQLLTQLADQMLNARYDELTRQADAPFVFAVSYQNDLVRTVQEKGVYAQIDDNQILTGTTALVTELERVRRHGFTATELGRAKQALLRSFEQQYAEREKSESASYADQYVNAYLAGSAIPSSAVEYGLAQRFLPAIELAEVNDQATALLAGTSRYLLVVAPEKADLTLPSEAELAGVLSAVQSATIEPYVDKVANAELVTDIPAPAAIVTESADTDLGLTQFELANGVEVILKPTDFKADEVLFEAVSPGGSSLVSDADFLEADNISYIVGNSGVGDFDYNALTRLLSGKVVAVNPYIDELKEGFSGNASTKDLTTLFQLIYLYVTAPRADESAFAAFQNQMRTALENRSLSVDAAFSDAITQARFGDSVRYLPPTVADLEQFDLARAQAIYQERFADVSDFTFVFVGSFDPAEIKELAQIYLGNLPGAGRQESWQDVRPDPPTGQIEQTVYKGQDEQSRTFLLFTGRIKPTPENRLTLDLLRAVLDLRLTDDLREELGGTYSPSVVANVAPEPDQSYGFYVTFGSDPKRVDELVQATWEDIADVQANGPHEDEFAKVIEQARRSHERSLRENPYWLNTLSDYAEDPSEPLDSTLDFAETLASIEPADIQTAAQEYLREADTIKVVQLPEGYQQ